MKCPNCENEYEAYTQAVIKLSLGQKLKLLLFPKKNIYVTIYDIPGQSIKESGQHNELTIE